LKRRDLGSRRHDEFGVRVRHTVQSPTALRRLGVQDPGAVPVEGSGVGQHLHPHVGRVAVDVGQSRRGELVHEGCRVLADIGMFGTCAMVMTVVARSTAS